jgi:hypothetical protein
VPLQIASLWGLGGGRQHLLYGRFGAALGFSGAVLVFIVCHRNEGPFMGSKYLTRSRTMEKGDVFKAEKSLWDLRNGDDRAFAIVCAAVVEDRLGLAMEARMARLSEADLGRLFHGLGPLGSASSRILVAYAMGIVGPKSRQDFETINEIRNEFAHNHDALTFASSQIAEKCDRLNWCQSEQGIYWLSYVSDEDREKGIDPWDGMILSKRKFWLTIRTLASGFIMSRVQQLPPRAQAMVRD